MPHGRGILVNQELVRLKAKGVFWYCRLRDQGVVRMLICLFVYISCRCTALRLRPDENRESAGAEAQQTDKKIAVRILRDSSLLHTSTRLRIQTSKRLFSGRIVDQQKKNRLDTPPVSSTSATSIHLLVFRRYSRGWQCPCPTRTCLTGLNPALLYSRGCRRRFQMFYSSLYTPRSCDGHEREKNMPPGV
jgi:hypothetical protein